LAARRVQEPCRHRPMDEGDRAEHRASQMVQPRPGAVERVSPRYAKEVHGQPELPEQLRDLARQGSLTLVYAARDTEHNDAVELRDLILGDGKP
jgi:uncharacterized protein YeaO (DUF488 family)